MDWEKYKGKMEPDNRWVEDARRARGDINVARAIEARLENEPDAAVRRRLNFDLTTEYEMAGRYDEAERIYLMLFDQCPDEPMPLISLAGQKLYFENDPAAAMEAIDRAIEVAYRSNNFRRLALGVKARIALAREKFDVVEDVLRRLLQLTHDKRGVDIAPERDFFDRLPPGAKPWRAGSIIIFRARAPLVGRALSGENSAILRDAILKDRSSG
jgi:tetratricopeptide (TPR) repeat protein